eukprot:970437-Amphidinium_carterae.1
MPPGKTIQDRTSEVEVAGPAEQLLSSATRITPFELGSADGTGFACAWPSHAIVALYTAYLPTKGQDMHATCHKLLPWLRNHIG